MGKKKLEHTTLPHPSAYRVSIRLSCRRDDGISAWVFFGCTAVAPNIAIQHQASKTHMRNVNARRHRCPPTEATKSWDSVRDYTLLLRYREIKRCPQFVRDYTPLLCRYRALRHPLSALFQDLDYSGEIFGDGFIARGSFQVNVIIVEEYAWLRPCAIVVVVEPEACRCFTVPMVTRLT